MASPPYSYSPTALSPPPSQSYSNAKKRPSESGMAPSLKRRKASNMSVSSSATHPLRQTSFPPDESQSSSFYDTGARSPSVDSMSLVSGMGGGGGSQVSAAGPLKKKRGRKSKAEKAAAMREREQTPSVAGGVARSGVSDVRGGGRGSTRQPPGTDAAADEEDENIELDRADVQVAAKVQEITAEQKEEENKFRNMLVDAFSEEQFARYEAWRASGFSKSTVRKVRLSTLSGRPCFCN